MVGQDRARDGHNCIKRTKFVRYGRFGKDHHMGGITIETSIPEEVFGEKGLSGYIDKNGEWKEGSLRVKKEDGIEYIALSSELKLKTNWSNSRRAIPFIDYIRNQIRSCKRRGKGYRYDVFYEPVKF